MNTALRNESSKTDMEKRSPIAYVIDDDSLIIKTICVLLESRNIKTQGYTSAKLFLEEFGADVRDCIICDYRMPELDGLDVQRNLISRGIRTPLIFLSGNADVELTMSAWKDGAVTVIEKPFGSEELFSAVQKAFEFGQQEWDKIQAQKRFENVKPEELIVLKYLVQGLINKQIASRLNVSERTVERRKSNLQDVTRTRSVIEAIDLARRAEIDLSLE